MLINIRRVVSIKMNLHHSHVTGKILGYAHDFCNTKVTENQNRFSLLALNFFGCNMFFLLKGIQLSVWETKDLNIGGSGLPNINSASLCSQVKIIYTIKYYLSRLGSPVHSLDDVEKLRVEKVILQFLNQHDHFSEIWPLLDFSQKRKSFLLLAERV